MACERAFAVCQKALYKCPGSGRTNNEVKSHSVAEQWLSKIVLIRDYVPLLSHLL